MIDLHTHTTASDGRATPSELVTRAAAAGVSVLSVTDHDTVAGCAEAERVCGTAGIGFVPGIEITAVRDDADVHVLGYFIDTHAATLHGFLLAQRQERFERVRRIVERLMAHGIVLDADSILQPGVDDAGKSPGRPWIARALVSDGRVGSTAEAFDRWLAEGRPAFVPRQGRSPQEVVEIIHDVGGVASLAHPGLLRRDDWIEELASAGLDAIEAYHSEHDPEETVRYLGLANRLGLAVSGGSDFHADDTHGGGGPGSISLPPDRFEALRARRRTGRASL